MQQQQRQRRRRRPVLVVLALWVIGSVAAAGESSETEADQTAGVNVAGSPHFVRKSDRLEAIKRYILDRLNVSDSRRFNRSTPPPPPPTTMNQQQRAAAGPSVDGDREGRAPAPAPVSTQSFGSLSEAMRFYARQTTTEDDGRVERRPPPARARSRHVKDGVQRRRRRLHPVVDESEGGSSEPRKRGAAAGHRRATSTKRRQRKHVKLTMTADTGENVYHCPASLVKFNRMRADEFSNLKSPVRVN